MNDDFNLAERILCEDDACIGLVGADGKCKVCGLKYSGVESLPVPGDGAAVSGGTGDGEDGDAAAAAGGVDFSSDTSVDSDVDERVLCPDETCIGIIGSDGTCGTCGKSA